jgi:O-acetyl-ADP-ribose deacetylase (regulator of RNase III)
VANATRDVPGSTAPHSPPAVTARWSVTVDDLTFFAGDAIARPVNESLGATTALVRRLETAALDGERGQRLAQQLRPAEPLAVGSAVVTGAGALGAELLIHAVVLGREERVTRETVRRATTSALQRAADFAVVHLGIAPFGLGAGNLDPDDAAAAMADPIARHLAASRHPERLTVVVETDDEARAFAAALGRAAAATAPVR